MNETTQMYLKTQFYNLRGHESPSEGAMAGVTNVQSLILCIRRRQHHIIIQPQARVGSSRHRWEIIAGKVRLRTLGEERAKERMCAAMRVRRGVPRPRRERSGRRWRGRWGYDGARRGRSCGHGLRRV